jgi:hypothetical protein
LTAAWPIARDGDELRVSARGNIATAGSRCWRWRRFFVVSWRCRALDRDRRDRLRARGRADNGYRSAWGVTRAENPFDARSGMPFLDARSKLTASPTLLLEGK